MLSCTENIAAYPTSTFLTCLSDPSTALLCALLGRQSETRPLWSPTT